MITIDTFLEFLKEVLKGTVRAISAYLFQSTFLNKEKATRRDKQKGGSQKQ